jgi:hypothetical protein
MGAYFRGLDIGMAHEFLDETNIYASSSKGVANEWRKI